MKFRFLLALFFPVVLRLAAQDVTVTGLSWADPNDPPDTLPVARIPVPDYPERLHGSTEIGYVIERPFIDAKGKSPARRNIFTDPLFDETVPVSDWYFKPARRAGEPVNSCVQFTVIFNPECASAKKPDATPRLLDVVAPQLPGKLVEAGAEESPAGIHVTATVDSGGHVTKAVADAGVPEALGPLAEDAVLKWTFAPARKNGQPVVQDVRVPVVFWASDDLKADSPPRVIHQEQPVYPLGVRRNGWRGEVRVGFIIGIEGRVRNAEILSSTNPALNQAAIDAVLKWRFEPATRQGIPVNIRVSELIVFELEDTPGGGGEPYQVSDDMDQSKLPNEVRYDVAPKPQNTVFAVYPFELLRDKVKGSADVKFLVAPDGRVVQSRVVKATRSEFGQALMAMFDEWRFQPAMKDGKPTLALLEMEQTFETYGDDVPVSDSARDLLSKLKKDKLVLCSIQDLDARPQLRSTNPPVFPSALNGKVAQGQAVVEFLIDHDGNVQLPRIVSATDPAFGYAAVQGVSAWKFVPPTSHGKPVVVRAQIPVKFTAPKPEPAADAAAPSSDVHADTKPQPVFQSAPSFPPALKKAGFKGEVKVGFVIDAEGRVRNPEIISSTNPDLNQPVLDAVLQWRYKPGKHNGVPTDMHVTTPFTFQADDNAR